MTSHLTANARDLERELDWFACVLDTRLKDYFGQEFEHAGERDVAPPDLRESESPYADFVRRHELTLIERTALILALVPHVRPHALDTLFTTNKATGRPFTDVGGRRLSPGGSFLPTGETLMFLLAGEDLATRFEVRSVLAADHLFARTNVLDLTLREGGEPSLSAPLLLTDEYVSLFTTGRWPQPELSAAFPARRLETTLDWDDLVLEAGTRGEIDEIRVWLAHGATLLNTWGLAARVRPGYRSVFHGPPGTGKSLAATLLGKASGRDVYRIDLSTVVSKWIGETEKNLSRVFDHAQSRRCILFFDEAAALFGTRSETRDAQDRHAKLEVSYLLQRLESFDGLAIVSTNLRTRLDDAFLRRFQSIVHFPLPGPEERLRLWRELPPAGAELDPSVDLEELASEYELTGGSIVNVIRYASLRALSEDRRTIAAADLIDGIRREFRRQGSAV